MNRVIRLNDNARDRYETEFGIISPDLIIEKQYCQCFDRYGQIIGCTNAGCWSPNNKECDFQKGDEEEHDKAKVLEYWDGHNWISILLEHPFFTENAVLLEEDSELAKEILRQFKAAEKPDFDRGSREFEREFETENFEFSQSRFANDPFIASVNVGDPSGIIELL